MITVTAASTPPPITRDSARAAARLELSKRKYHTGDESLTTRIVRWLAHRLEKLLDDAPAHAPGHALGLLLIVVVVAAVIAVVVTRVGVLRRSARVVQPLLGDEVTTAADHRRRAAEFAQSGAWAEAIREHLRAITRELQSRGVLDDRPGRTAAEMCAEASQQMPEIADDLRRATSVFDAVWYGRATAGPDDEQVLRALDDRLAGSRRNLAGRA